jgi:hypothetical protein
MRSSDYFRHFAEHPSHSATTDRSLEAIKKIVPADVADHHEMIMHRHIEQLMGALESIAKGFPCSTKEAMQRVANNALPINRRKLPLS